MAVNPSGPSIQEILKTKGELLQQLMGTKSNLQQQEDAARIAAQGKANERLALTQATGFDSSTPVAQYMASQRKAEQEGLQQKAWQQQTFDSQGNLRISPEMTANAQIMDNMIKSGALKTVTNPITGESSVIEQVPGASKALAELMGQVKPVKPEQPQNQEGRAVITFGDGRKPLVAYNDASGKDYKLGGWQDNPALKGQQTQGSRQGMSTTSMSSTSPNTQTPRVPPSVQTTTPVNQMTGAQSLARTEQRLAQEGAPQINIPGITYTQPVKTPTSAANVPQTTTIKPTEAVSIPNTTVNAMQGQQLTTPRGIQTGQDYSPSAATVAPMITPTPYYMPPASPVAEAPYAGPTGSPRSEMLTRNGGNNSFISGVKSLLSSGRKIPPRGTKPTSPREY